MLARSGRGPVAANLTNWVGIVIVVAILGCLLTAAALRPAGPARACAVFLIVYCIAASYTEAGLGDASPYLLNLALAVALLVSGTATAAPAAARPQGSLE